MVVEAMAVVADQASAVHVSNLLLLLPPCHESYDKCQKEKFKYECTDASDYVAMSYKEGHVASKRNLTLDFSRLPPWGRLKYFT